MLDVFLTDYTHPLKKSVVVTIFIYITPYTTFELEIIRHIHSIFFCHRPQKIQNGKLYLNISLAIDLNTETFHIDC